MANVESTLSLTRDRRLTRRGADTREKILDATVACIVRSGFAAMTVENVMVEAGISRGSVLHQFPTRIALTIAVVKQAMAVVMDEARGQAQQIEDPYQRLLGYAKILWDTHSRPEGLALTDILQSARWDKELSAGIRPMTAVAETEVAAELTALAAAAGVPDPAVIVPHGWLLLATARGLIIESSLGFSRPMIAEAVEEMMRGHRRHCELLVPLSVRMGSAKPDCAKT